MYSVLACMCVYHVCARSTDLLKLEIQAVKIVSKERNLLWELCMLSYLEEIIGAVAHLDLHTGYNWK